MAATNLPGRASFTFCESFGITRDWKVIRGGGGGLEDATTGASWDDATSADASLKTLGTRTTTSGRSGRRYLSRYAFRVDRPIPTTEALMISTSIRLLARSRRSRSGHSPPSLS